MENIQFNLIQSLVAFGVVNGIILCSLLFFTKKNALAAKWMGLFILARTVNLLNYTFVSKLYDSIDWFTLVRIPTIFSFGLLTWLYTKYLIDSDFRLKGYQKWLPVPFYLDVLYSFLHAAYIYHFRMNEKADLFYVHKEHLVHEGIAILYSLVMVVLAINTVRKYNRGLLKTHSSIRNVDLRWLGIFFLLLLLPTIAWLILYGVEFYLYPKYLPFSAYYPLWCYSIIISMVLGYRSLLQPELQHSKTKQEYSSQGKYQSSGLEVEDISLFARQLKNEVETKKLYLTAGLKLADLSKEIELSPHQISQVISEGLNTNFYDFINQYRIEEVKSKLASSEAEQFNLLGLAFDAGFNSKTAFYTAFKKYVGVSPSQYRKSLKS